MNGFQILSSSLPLFLTRSEVQIWFLFLQIILFTSQRDNMPSKRCFVAHLNSGSSIFSQNIWGIITLICMATRDITNLQWAKHRCCSAKASLSLSAQIYIITQNRHEDPQAQLSPKDVQHMNGYYSLYLKSPRIAQKGKGKHTDWRIRKEFFKYEGRKLSVKYDKKYQIRYDYHVLHK